MFRTDAAMFQAVWFTISLLTEMLVVLVLRAWRLSWRSRPSTLLAASTAIMAVVAIALPHIPGFDGLFGFETPTWHLVVFSIALVAAYASATEHAKRLFFKGQGKRKPIGQITKLVT